MTAYYVAFSDTEDRSSIGRAMDPQLFMLPYTALGSLHCNF
jgi:hypothetical protein